MLNWAILRPEWPDVLLRWTIEPGAVVLIAAAVVLYARGWQALRDHGVRATQAGHGVRATQAGHGVRVTQAGHGVRATQAGHGVRAGLDAVPRRRHAVLFGSGMATLCIALLSPVDVYADALLSVHMVQHVLLVFVAAPLLAGSRSTTVLLAGLPERPAAALRGLARTPAAQVVLHPIVGWVLFAATGWVVHFSPLFDTALRHAPVHALEHGLFLAAALLFWRPVVGRDPLSYPLRLLYLGLAMPQNTFLALAIYSANHPLYDTYARMRRPWGPGVLDDQRLGGGLMWVAGDLTLLVAVLAVAAAWGTASVGAEDGTAEDGADVAVNGR